MTSNGRWSVPLDFAASANWRDGYMQVYFPVRVFTTPMDNIVTRHLDADADSYGMDWGSDE